MFEFRRDYDGERKEKSLKRWIITMIVLLVLVLCTSLRFTEIRVIGNETYTAEEIEELVFPELWDKNLIVCLVKDRFMHKELPFIEDYDIQLTGPFSCDLVIYEKSIVGYIEYMSSCMYFDKDGIIVENSSERLLGVPLVTGLQFGHIVLNKPLPISDSEVFAKIMHITQQLSYYGIGADRIHFNRLREATVYIDGGNIEVELGGDEDMDAKLSVLNDMLPELQERGLKGTLDLRNYQDNAKNQINSFKIRKETDG